MSRVNYNPSAVKEITVWEPVAVTVADELAGMLWKESPCLRNDPVNRERSMNRWRRAGIGYGDSRWDSQKIRSGVLFDNREEALQWLKENLLQKYVELVKQGVRTALAGKTKPGFVRVRNGGGMIPPASGYCDPENFWGDYYDYIVIGKVNKRNSYAWRKKQYWRDEVEAFALRAEKRVISVPA